MNATDLKEILHLHQLWLNDDPQGHKANLYDADLSHANLSHVNLSHAYLSHANLSHVNLSGANLFGAYLPHANLSGASLSGASLFHANLSDASLSHADLSGASLSRANLFGAYLPHANLSGASLSGANLFHANLSDASLSHADLSEANLSHANLSGTTLPNFQICPEVGSFQAWKKLGLGVVALLEIPEDADRTSNLVGRKCRASHARVLRMWDADGHEITTPGFEVGSWLHSDFRYRLGEIVTADAFDPDIRIECTSGIHFFMTRAEAEQF